VDELRVAAQRPAGLRQDAGQAAGIAGAEPAAGEEHPLREGRPARRLRLRAEFGERVVDMGTELRVRDVAATVAHEQPLVRQQPFGGEPVERGQHQPLCQVSGRPEKHERHRLLIVGCLAPSRAVCHVWLLSHGQGVV